MDKALSKIIGNPLNVMKQALILVRPMQLLGLDCFIIVVTELRRIAKEPWSTSAVLKQRAMQ